MTERTPLLVRMNTPPPVASVMVLQATATLGASLLGSGILSQPFACRNCGLAFYVFCSVFAVMLSHMTSIFLARSSLFLNCDSYAALVETVFGKAGRNFTAGAVIFQQIGCCTAYIVVAGDVFHPLVAHWTNMDVQEWVIKSGASIFLLLPLCVFVRDLSSFRYTSAISVLVITIFAAVVVGNGFYILIDQDADTRRQELINHGKTNEYFDLKGPYIFPQDSGFLRSISIICFAYFMHFNSLPVLKTLSPLGTSGAEDAFYSASLKSFFLSVNATCAFGIFGYLTFLNATNSDILTNFSVTGTYVSSIFNVVRSLYGVGLLLAFPVVLWEATANIKLLAFEAEESGGGSGVIEPNTTLTSVTLNHGRDIVDLEGYQIIDEVDMPLIETKRSGEVSFGVHALITSFLVLLTTVLGIGVKDLGVVFGFIGSTCVPILAYILPSLVYLRSGVGAKYQDELKAKIALFFGVALIPLGMVIWGLDQAGTWDEAP